MTGLRIRPMTAGDSDEVAAMRVRGWRHAYRGLMPQAYLDGMDVAAEAERQRARLAAGDGSVVNLVAETEDGTLAGGPRTGPTGTANSARGTASCTRCTCRPSASARAWAAPS